MKPHWLEVIFGCFHQWKVREEAPIKQFGVVQGKLHVLECEKCGDISYRKFSTWDL